MEARMSRFMNISIWEKNREEQAAQHVLLDFVPQAKQICTCDSRFYGRGKMSV